jgi:hypothetical protein
VVGARLVLVNDLLHGSAGMQMLGGVADLTSLEATVEGWHHTALHGTAPYHITMHCTDLCGG